jgi:YidC/Oxa1 family membrane protein insertase
VAELFGAIQRGLGSILSGVYEVIPSYALAIVLLTVVTRLLLLPLTIKQMRSMRTMQKIAPQLKEIQKKFKDQQKRVADRKELQELRLKQNQEVMALYREHGASPAGGCLPMLAQMPVFIALFSLMRATLFLAAVGATTAAGADIPSDVYTKTEAQNTICSPAAPTEQGLPITCSTFNDADEVTETQDFLIPRLDETDSTLTPLAQAGEVDLAWVARCNPVVNEETVDGQVTPVFATFACTSATGTGHLPRASALFADVNGDSATILTMHAGCSPSQARSKRGMLQCTAGDQDTGLGAVIPYYLLVLLIAGTQYVSGRQMMARAQGPQAQQAAMMTKIMPLFFGFISLSFPVGLNFYYLIFNLWQMGQQHLTNKKLDEEEAAAERMKGKGEAPPAKRGFMERAREKVQTRAELAPPEPSADDAEPVEPKKAHPRSKKKRKRKR